MEVLSLCFEESCLKIVSSCGKAMFVFSSPFRVLYTGALNLRLNFDLQSSDVLSGLKGSLSDTLFLEPQVCSSNDRSASRI